MNQSNSLGVHEPMPPVPTICRWTGWLVGLPFAVLSLVGALLETALGQAGFMAQPGTLIAFGVLVLCFALSLLGWFRTWLEYCNERRRWRKRNRTEAMDWRMPRWQRIYLAFFGIMCAADGVALLVGAISKL